MSYDIAVFKGKDGMTVPLYEKGRLTVYRKKHGLWSVLREREFLLDRKLGMKGLRSGMEEAAAFLSGCKIFVGLDITGIPYYVLEKHGFSIWEYEGKPESFLDVILEKEEESRASEKDNKYLAPCPEEIFPGCYRISIKEIQENNTGFTSKQVLLPFLRRGCFYSLEVYCNHVPPWLEAELAGSGRNGEIRRAGGGEVVVTIAGSCCGVDPNN
ncbi:MAG: Fe-only nitrogenase accessory AnfO family protein [Bacillota bacterium]